MPASPTTSDSPRAAWPATSIWAGVAACVIGLAVHRMWQVLPAGRFGESLLLAALAASMAWPLRRWRGWAWADAIALVWALALVALTGVLPALAVAAMVAAAAALGGLVVGRAQPLLALLAGLAMLATLIGWTLPLPVHRWWAYWPLLALVIGLRRRFLCAQASLAIASWRRRVDAAPRAAAWSVMLLGLASAGAWLPTMQYDDLAYHLGLPWQLLLQGRYALDPTHQVWALAPWAGDVLQAIAQVLARQEARGALNAVWLLATAAGLMRLGGLLGLDSGMRWVAVALFASLPMVAALLGGMQTELPATAVLVALAVVVLDDQQPCNPRASLITGALLFGLLCALKPLHGATALPLIAWGAWRVRRQLGWPWLPYALATVAVVAGSSYTYAWLLTGNPVLPLLNGLFHSPYFGAYNFNDGRWQAGLGAGLPWRLTFDTARYLEGWNGGIGFVLVALAGAWVVALADVRTRALAICATLALALPLLPLQYARYVHPGMVLLLVAMVAAVSRALPARPALWLLAGICTLNLAFQANSQWFLHTGAIKRSLVALGRDGPLFERYAAERRLAAAIRDQAPHTGRVLLLDQAAPRQAELAGRGLTTAWYAPQLEAARVAADRDPGGAAWAALLRRERIAEVVLRPATLLPAQRAGLDRVGATHELSVGEAQWWRIPTQHLP